MKFTRILSLVLVVLMLVTTLASCTVLDTVKEYLGLAEEVVDAPEVENLELELVRKGAPRYTIVYDYKAGPLTKNAILTMVEAFKDFLNCEVEAKECYSDREVEEDFATDFEILVGSTNRPESAKVLDGMKNNDYDIDVVGTKVVIAGGSDSATAKAVAGFLGGFVYEQGDKNEVRKNGKKFSLMVYKNVDVPEDEADPLYAERSEKAKYDVDHEDFTSNGIYSYNYVTMGGARIDSYTMIYPRAGSQSADCRSFAMEMQSYISKEAGMEIDVKKDAAVLRADFKILIGDTSFTDHDFAETLEDDEYYIALTEEEIELEDGSTAKGATLTILFGADAYETAMEAFKRIMPVSSAPIDFNMSAGFVDTNMELPAQE